jgi:hypothetical protein
MHVTDLLTCVCVQAVSMLLWTHAHLRRMPQGQLLVAAVTHARECEDAYTTQGSSNLLWALHVLLPPKRRFYDIPVRDVVRVFERHSQRVLHAVVRPAASCASRAASSCLQSARVARELLRCVQAGSLCSDHTPTQAYGPAAVP